MKLAALIAGAVALAGSSALAADALAAQQAPISAHAAGIPAAHAAGIPAAHAAGIPAAHAAGVPAVLARSVHVRRGIAPIVLACRSGPCDGLIQLGGSKTARGLYGSASFSLNAGTQTVVEVRLSSAGRQLLKGGLQVVAWATVSLRGSRSAASRVPLTLSAFTVIANHWQPGFNKLWSGYAVIGQKFTAVRGTFVQPSMPSCGGSSAGSPEAPKANNVDIWSGLDGFGNGALEQVGTEVVCYVPSGGTPSIAYFAWYETFPDSLIGIPIAIHPGDTIFTEVKAVSPQHFAMTLEDKTTAAKWSEVVYQHTPAHQISAEWIDETQGVSLPTITTTSWSNVSATARGVTAPLGTPPNAEVAAFVTFDSRSHRHVEPSPLSDAGDAFNISWLAGA
jgi:Peptidase A4 family